MTLLVVLVSLFLVSADFEKGSKVYSLNATKYIQEGNVKGWVNLSFNNESSENIFEDNNGNEISLGKLLSLNNLDQYCTIPNCGKTYSSSNPEQTKTFSLSSGQEKIIGFKLSGDVQAVNNIEFTIESDASESCKSQFEIDFLNQEQTILTNNLASDNVCSTSPRCFDSSQGIEEKILKEDSEIYCDKVTISSSPGLKLGAWLKNTNSADGTINLYLKDNQGNPLFNEGESEVFCEIQASEITDSGEEYFCEVNYSIKEEKDYYVCVDYSGDEELRLRANSDSEQDCGYYGNINDKTRAYDFVAKEMGYAQPLSINITDEQGSYESLSSEVYNYLINRYSLNCSNSECFVPLKIKSNTNQELTITDLVVNYDSPEPSETSTLYDLNKTSSKVNSGFIKINLDNGNFTLPGSPASGAYEFILDYNEANLFTENLTIVGKVEINYLLPQKTFNSYPTNFEANIESNNKSISKYYWEFGDGNNKTTNSNKVTHTYNETGKYTLILTITDEDGIKNSKNFEIQVGSASEILEQELNQTQNNLENLKNKINEYSGFYKSELQRILNITGNENKLSSLQEDFIKASFEQDYVDIMNDFLGLYVPETFVTTYVKDQITFVTDKNNVDIEVLEKISNSQLEEYSSDKIKKAVESFGISGINSKISFKVFSYKEKDYLGNLITIYELDISRLDSSDTLYVVFSDNSINTPEQSSVSETGEKYIEISPEENSKTIYFSTTQDLIDPKQSPVFISPSLENLEISRDINPSQVEDNFNWVLFWLILLILLLIAIGIYIFLQEWYKRKYEDYLFKGRNNMYNLINYVSVSKEKGKKNKEIIEHLKKAGWNKEQINYVMRKYHGKRTGMLEIPVEGIINFFNKNSKKSHKTPKTKNNKTNMKPQKSQNFPKKHKSFFNNSH